MGSSSHGHSFPGCFGSSLVSCFWPVFLFFFLAGAEFCFLKGVGFEMGMGREEEWSGRGGFGGGPWCHREWR